MERHFKLLKQGFLQRIIVGFPEKRKNNAYSKIGALYFYVKRACLKLFLIEKNVEGFLRGTY